MALNSLDNPANTKPVVTCENLGWSAGTVVIDADIESVHSGEALPTKSRARFDGNAACNLRVDNSILVFFGLFEK